MQNTLIVIEVDATAEAIKYAECELEQENDNTNNEPRKERRKGKKARGQEVWRRERFWVEPLLGRGTLVMSRGPEGTEFEVICLGVIIFTIICGYY